MLVQQEKLGQYQVNPKQLNQEKKVEIMRLNQNTIMIIMEKNYYL
jgi:hypothetical protein